MAMTDEERRERNREAQRRYRERHPHRNDAHARRYRERNREKLREYAREYYRRNHPGAREYRRTGPGRRLMDEEDIPRRAKRRTKPMADEERRGRRREYRRRYRERHPDAQREEQRRYREAHRERLREYQREYYRKHHPVIGRRRNAENRKRRHDAAPDGFRHLLKSADACRLLRCSRETLRELRDAREIIAVRNPSGGKTASFLHDPVSIAILLNSESYPRIISHSKSQRRKIQHFR